MPIVRSIRRRHRTESIFKWICVAMVIVAIGLLGTLLGSILYVGLPHLNVDFITSMASKDADRSGILPALLGSIYVCAICCLIAVPIGIGSAVLLEEYQPKHPMARRCHKFVNLNITNLAGVPSIVYGILGVTAFAQMFGAFGLPGEGLSIGQRWFDQYQAAGGQGYFIPVGKGADPAPASPEMTFYTDTDLSKVATLRFAEPDDIVPIRDSVEAEMRRFGDVLSSELDKYRGGSRNTGPVSIDRAGAEAVVDAALGAATFRSDIASLRSDLIDRVDSLDGLESRELRGARRELIALAVDQEVASQLAGVMMIGKQPLRVDRRAWYYLSLPLGRGLVAGGLTLMLVVLPVIVVASQEAIRAVPQSLRHGSMALGSTRWQAIRQVVLPAAVPGICTGTILAMSRAIGEAAPLLILAGVVFISFTPANLMDNFTVLPLQIYNWASRPGDDFREIAATGIIVLLAVLLTFNALAVFIRQKYTPKN